MDNDLVALRIHLRNPGLAAVEEIYRLANDCHRVGVAGREFGAHFPERLDLRSEISHDGDASVSVMADLHDLIEAMDRLEKVLVQIAPAAGQKGLTSRLDEMWVAVAKNQEALIARVEDVRASIPREIPAPVVDVLPVVHAVEAKLLSLVDDLDRLAAKVQEDPSPAIDALSGRMANLEQAVAEAIRATPRAEGALAGIPTSLAEPLESIDHRLSAVERMGREQFELDQRLGLIDSSLRSLIEPFEDLAPRLQHVGELTEWLGRMEERLQSVATQLAPLVQDPDRAVRLMPRIDDLMAAIGALDDRIDQLSGGGGQEDAGRVGGPAVDAGALGAALSGLGAQLRAIEQPITDQLETLATRVDALAGDQDEYASMVVTAIRAITEQLDAFRVETAHRLADDNGAPAPAAVDYRFEVLEAVHTELVPVLHRIDELGAAIGAISAHLAQHEGPPRAAGGGEAVAELPTIDLTPVLHRIDELAAAVGTTREPPAVPSGRTDALLDELLRRVGELGRPDPALRDVRAGLEQLRLTAADLQTDGGQTRLVRAAIEQLALDVEALKAIGRKAASADELSRVTTGLTAVGHDVEAAQQRLLELDRKVGGVRDELSHAALASTSMFQAAEAIQLMAQAIAGLEHRLDAGLDQLGRRVDSLASAVGISAARHDDDDDLRARAAENVTERISRLRDLAAGVGDAARTELRRRRHQPELGEGKPH